MVPAIAFGDTLAAAPPPLGVAMPPMSLQDAAAIAAALRQGADQGLPEPELSGALEALAGPDAELRARADATLSAAAIRLAGQQHGLGLEPQSIDRNFALRHRYDPSSDFAAARAGGGVAAWAAALAPTDPGYRALAAARPRYAAIAAAGGWGQIAAGRAPKLGATDARVPALRQRLAVEGYVAPEGKAQDLFDAALSVQIAAFQATHGLKADGALNAATLAALNVPAGARLAAIDANLERERWLPRQAPARRIVVDIAGPDATLFEDGQPVLSMRAIVGQPTKKTPMFASKVTGILFNPPWIVPAGIARAELFPKERRSPGYFARNDFYVTNGQVIQRAGPKSALGYVKFEMPNAFDVYLHDTPARSLFQRERRWLSHGCMRLELPRDLAAALLAPQGWDRAQVDAAIARSDTRRVPLETQPPVFVVYRTVVATPDGRATFRPDVYGWDAMLGAARADRRP